MTGPEHYKTAETLLANLRREVSSSPGILLYTPEQQVRMIAEAQVHATLALAAATVEVALADRWSGPPDTHGLTPQWTQPPTGWPEVLS